MIQSLNGRAILRDRGISSVRYQSERQIENGARVSVLEALPWYVTSDLYLL